MKNDYYCCKGLEAIDIITAYDLNFPLGNVIKYVLRAGRKSDNDIEDLKKALDYLAYEITIRESHEDYGGHYEN